MDLSSDNPGEMMRAATARYMRDAEFHARVYTAWQHAMLQPSSAAEPRDRQADDLLTGALAALALADRGRDLDNDFVSVPRAELVALYGDAPVDVPVIRRVLGETK